MLTEKGYIKDIYKFKYNDSKKVYLYQYIPNKHYGIIKTFTKDNITKRMISNSYILKIFKNTIHTMEKEVWEDNADPDYDDMPVHSVITVESEGIIHGYILISERFFENKNFCSEINPSKRKYEIDNYKKLGHLRALDIEDLVMFDSKNIYKYNYNEIIKALSIVFNEKEADVILMNPNNNSKNMIKRIKEITNIPIKLYDYPSYKPYGYNKAKYIRKLSDEKSKILIKELYSNEEINLNSTDPIYVMKNTNIYKMFLSKEKSNHLIANPGINIDNKKYNVYKDFAYNGLILFNHDHSYNAFRYIIYYYLSKNIEIPDSIKDWDETIRVILEYNNVNG